MTQNTARNVGHVPGVGGKLNILIVEDDLIDRLQVFRGIEKTGIDCDLDEALTLAKAREFLVIKKYDFIILDNHLPDGYGARFAQEIKESGLSKGAKILMLTGEPNVAEAVVGGARPWQTVLSKDDFSFSKLRAILLAEETHAIQVTNAQDCLALFKVLADKDLAEALSTLENLNQEVWGRIDGGGGE